MKQKTTTGHDQLAEQIALCIASAEGLSDPAPIMIGVLGDLRAALDAVRDRAAALKVAGAPAPPARKPSPTDRLQELHASRIRFGRPRRRGLLARLRGF